MSLTRAELAKAKKDAHTAPRATLDGVLAKLHRSRYAYQRDAETALVRTRVRRFGFLPGRRPAPSTPADDVILLALKFVWPVTNIYEGPEVFAASVADVPPFLRQLFAARFLESEVSNGGFHQFFWNPTGVVTPLARECFVTLKATRLARCVDDAVKLLGPKVKLLDQTSRQRATGKLTSSSTKFDRLDGRFYDACESEFHTAAKKHLLANWDRVFTS